MSKGFTTDSFLMVNYGIMYEIGDLQTAAVLSVLRGLRESLLKNDKLAEDGGFYMQRHRIAERVCMKNLETVTIHCKKLVKLGLEWC